MKEAIKCLGCSSEKERVVRILEVCNRPIVRKDRRENLQKRAKTRIKVFKKNRKYNDKEIGRQRASLTNAPPEGIGFGDVATVPYPEGSI